MQAFLRARASSRPDKSAEEFLIGLFHKKLSDLWIRLSGIPRTKCAGEFTEDETVRLCCLIKHFHVTVTETNPFEQAQVCCGGDRYNGGGIRRHWNPAMSRPIFCGGDPDVDGMCGGYNLQWAWSSGFTAGKAASVLNMFPPLSRFPFYSLSAPQTALPVFCGAFPFTVPGRFYADFPVDCFPSISEELLVHRKILRYTLIAGRIFCFGDHSVKGDFIIYAAYHTIQTSSRAHRTAAERKAGKGPPDCSGRPDQLLDTETFSRCKKKA